MDHRAQIEEAEHRLLQAPQMTLVAGPGWADEVPSRAGVYLVRETRTGSVVYVGETSDLRSRFRDLGRFENHTFRRIASKALGIPREAGEQVLSTAMARTYTIAFLPLPFGRAEVEEYLILRFRDTLLNKPALRLQRGDQYSWVNQRRP